MPYESRAIGFRPAIEILLENGADPVVVKHDILQWLEKYKPSKDFLGDSDHRKLVKDFLNKISPDKKLREEPEDILKEENELAEVSKSEGLDGGLDSDSDDSNRRQFKF